MAENRIIAAFQSIGVRLSGTRDFSDLLQTALEFLIGKTGTQLTSDMNGNTCAAGGGSLYTFRGAFNATEAIRSAVIAQDCTMREARWVTSTAQPANGALTLTLRKNGADTAIVVTVTAGAAAGVFVDSSNTVDFSAGDTMSWKGVNASPDTVSAQILGWAVRQTPR